MAIEELFEQTSKSQGGRCHVLTIEKESGLQMMDPGDAASVCGKDLVKEEEEVN